MLLDPVTVQPTTTVDELRALLRRSAQRVFPVVGVDGYEGMIESRMIEHSVRGQRAARARRARRAGNRRHGRFGGRPPARGERAARTRSPSSTEGASWACCGSRTSSIWWLQTWTTSPATARRRRARHERSGRPNHRRATRRVGARGVGVAGRRAVGRGLGRRARAADRPSGRRGARRRFGVPRRAGCAGRAQGSTARRAKRGGR